MPRLLVLVLTVCVLSDGYEIFPELTFQRPAPGSSAQQCLDLYKMYRENLNNQTEWAVRMWESSARQPLGWVSGHTAQYGHFDECVNTQAPMPVKFCLTSLQIKLPNQTYPQDSVWHRIQNPPEDGYNIGRTSVWMGVCLPQACHPSLSTVPDQSNPYNITWDLQVLEPFCTDANQDFPVDWGAVALLVVTGLLVLFVWLATMFDSPSYNVTVVPKYVLDSFSMKQNFRTLLAPISNPENPVAIAHGLKVLAVSFIIYEHRFALRYTMSALNHEDYEKNSRDLIFQYTTQFDTAVDVFFFMSGLLLSYVGVPKHANPIAVIIVRIFRLSPVYMYSAWLTASIMPYLGSGPMWKAMQLSGSENCAKNWWLNLFFIQNYVRDDQLCNTHTWYVAADFHCFLVGLLLLLALKWHRKVGIALIVLVTAVAVVIPGILSYAWNLEPFFRFYHPRFLSNPLAYKPFKDLYIKSHNRIAIYLVGLIGGLHFAATKHQHEKRNKQKSVIYFCIALLLMMLPGLYGVTMDADNIQAADAVYSALRRPIWGVALFFLLLANKAHPLVLLQPVLTCRMVAVLSRLTFAVFVFHFMIVIAEFASMRNGAFFSYYDVLNSSLGIFSVIFAFLSYMFIEQPIKLFLTGLCFPRRTPCPQTEENIQAPKITSIAL